MMAIRHVLLDLDGTLVDSVAGIEHSLRQAISGVAPDLSVPSIRRYMGPPIRDIVRAIFPALSEEDQEAVVRRFRQSYDGGGWRLTEVYPGVVRGLSRLRRLGLWCYVVTNKPLLPAVRMIEQLGLSPYLEEVVSPDSTVPASGSKAETISFLLEQRGIARAESVYVGDREEDAIAAETCGLRFVAVAYGYGPFRAGVKGCGAHAIGEFSDLLALVEPGCPCDWNPLTPADRPSGL